MPMYLYKNLNTGEKYNIKQDITDPHLTYHPVHGQPIKRLVQLPAIKLNAKGFYSTDNLKGKGRTQ